METRAHKHGLHGKHRARRVPEFGEMCLRHDKVVRATEPAAHIVEHSTFDQIVLAAIVCSISIAVWGMIDHDHEDLIEALDYSLLLFFGAEIGIRVKRAGRNWYKDPWIWIDLIIIGVALLPLGSDAIFARVVRGARLLHVSRHLPHLRHLPAMLRLVRAARLLHLGRHLGHLKHWVMALRLVRKF